MCGTLLYLIAVHSFDDDAREMTLWEKRRFQQAFLGKFRFVLGPFRFVTQFFLYCAPWRSTNLTYFCIYHIRTLSNGCVLYLSDPPVRTQMCRGLCPTCAWDVGVRVAHTWNFKILLQICKTLLYLVAGCLEDAVREMMVF